MDKIYLQTQIQEIETFLESGFWIEILEDLRREILQAWQESDSHENIRREGQYYLMQALNSFQQAFEARAREKIFTCQQQLKGLYERV